MVLLSANHYPSKEGYKYATYAPGALNTYTTVSIELDLSKHVFNIVL